MKGPRPLLQSTLSLLLPLSTTFITWKGLCLLTNSSRPIVCVVSESMAPAFHRGDILVLWNWTRSVEPGDIPVVWFGDNPLPMVHRVLHVSTYNTKQGHDSPSTTQIFLTKGDNNLLNDVALYPEDRTSVLRKEVVGFVRGYVPLVGWIVIGMQELSWVKPVVFVLVAITVLFST
ncbi:putative signal peptidase complex catalytic subunit SEC11 [Hypoxylon crocopeplum]|nr:putative signal peptidase complex catalytic subunit SEC11 [Hypoxylon crocopeplum]